MALPTLDDITCRHIVLSSLDENIYTDIYNIVNRNLLDSQLYMGLDETEKTHIRYSMMSIIKYLVNLYSRLDGEFFIIPILNDDDENLFLITRQTQTFIPIICYYIDFNFARYGIFTEYWEKLKFIAITRFVHDMDIIVTPTQSTEDSETAFDQSFEQCRNETLERVFGEHHNHNLHFSNKPAIPRTEDNKECQLCCEPSDYVCEACHEPLCCSCIHHLKHSTNKCPACQMLPITLQKINDGKDYDDTTFTDKNESNNNEQNNDVNNELIGDESSSCPEEESEDETNISQPEETTGSNESDPSDESESYIDVINKCQE